MWATVSASVPGKWDIQVELPAGCKLQGPSVLPVLVWDGYLTVANSTQDPGEPSRVANSPADTGFIQFSMDRNRNTSGTPVDAWWVKAAGKAGSLGYVRSNATDGHLWAGGKERIRFWGTNMVFAASMLPKEYSPQLAARLSSAGFNMARLACTDGPVSNKDESLAMSDGQSVNLTMLDRLHFFASEAQNRGIYMHLVAHQLRSYCNVTQVQQQQKQQAPPATAIASGNTPGLVAMESGTIASTACPKIGTDDKGITYFARGAIESQKQWMRSVLLPSNPYTGRPLGTDPALAIVELSNEDGLARQWGYGKIDDAFEQVPTLGHEMQSLWVQWQLKPGDHGKAIEGGCRSPSPSHANGPDDSHSTVQWPEVLWLSNFTKPGVTQTQQLCWIAFLMDTETAFAVEMEAFLREEIGFHGTMVISQNENVAASSVAVAAATGMSLAADVHVYWADFFSDVRWADPIVPNVPGAGRSDGALAAALSSFRQGGMPFVSSESNTPHPSTFGAEHPALLAAVLRAQDWDGANSWAHSVIRGAPNDSQPAWSCSQVGTLYQDGCDAARMVVHFAASALALASDVDDLPQSEAQVVDTTLGQFVGRVRERVLEGGGVYTGVMVAGTDFGMDPSSMLQQRLVWNVSDAAGAVQPVSLHTPQAIVAAKRDRATYEWTNPGGHGVMIVRGGARSSVKLAAGMLHGYLAQGQGTEGWVDLGQGFGVRPRNAGSQGYLVAALVCVLPAEPGAATLAPLASCGSMVLVATGSGWQNTGMRFADQSRTNIHAKGISKWGQPPALFESSSVAIKLPCGDGDVWATEALASNGTRIGAGPSCTCRMGTCELDMPNGRTLWWSVVRQ